MNAIRELAEVCDVDPEPLIQAIEAAKQTRCRRYEQKRLVDAEPAQANRRLKQAHKAITALPLRAKASLHWKLAERLAYGSIGLDRDQIRRLMQDVDLVSLILDAVSEPVETEEPDRELHHLLQAWQHAGGAVEFEDRHDEDLIEFLALAYQHLGDTLTHDAIRRRLGRVSTLTPRN